MEINWVDLKGKKLIRTNQQFSIRSTRLLVSWNYPKSSSAGLN